ncbi:hypothetical protein IPH92_04860 [Candidatus Kaiserbacteria bacterium]|nr:MAG: hypothetical protein IPH92_04860 [Candidatus Kaiserbacteria bacterium]
MSYNKRILVGIIVGSLIGWIILLFRGQLTVTNIAVMGGITTTISLAFWLLGKWQKM